MRHATAHCHGRRLRDLHGDRVDFGVQALGRHHARDHAVPKRLVGVHHPAREHHVGCDTVPADLEEAGDAAGVGDDAVADLGQHEPGAFGGHSDVTQ